MNFKVGDRVIAKQSRRQGVVKQVDHRDGRVRVKFDDPSLRFNWFFFDHFEKAEAHAHVHWAPDNYEETRNYVKERYGDSEPGKFWAPGDSGLKCHGDDHVSPRIDGGCDWCGKEGKKMVDYANECTNDNHDPGCTCSDGHRGGGVQETWIEEAQRIVGGSRQEDYGDAEDMTAKIAAVWSQYLGVEVTPRQFCWMMVLLKAMRDSHRNKRDCPVDAHGYLLLMEKCSHDES